MRPILLGIFAAFFFASSFILNRSMSLSGGSWIWSASLRYIFMIPFLLLIVIGRKNLRSLLEEMNKHKGAWLLWSFVGFGLFYAPLTYAAAYGPGWLIAGTWQITIISGTLLVPFFYEAIQTSEGSVKTRRRIPLRGLTMSSLMLLGIVMMQVEHAEGLSVREVCFEIISVLIASFAYPLGNRKMMELCEGRLDTYQRVLGMTIASMPLWIVLSVYGLYTEGAPSSEQTVQTLLVAISSGVIATVLFFRATDLVNGNMSKLAAVEATQSLEVLFSVLGEVALLGAAFPSILSWLGMLLVIVGMTLHSIVTHQKKANRLDPMSSDMDSNFI